MNFIFIINYYIIIMFNLILNILECSSIIVSLYYIYCLNNKYKNLLKNIEKYKNDNHFLKNKNNNLEKSINDNYININNKLEKLVTLKNLNSLNEKLIELENNLNNNISSLENKYDFHESQFFDLNYNFDNFKKINFNNFDFNNFNILKNELSNNIKDIEIYKKDIYTKITNLNTLKNDYYNYKNSIKTKIDNINNNNIILHQTIKNLKEEIENKNLKEEIENKNLKEEEEEEIENKKLEEEIENKNKLIEDYSERNKNMGISIEILNEKISKYEELIKLNIKENNNKIINRLSNEINNKINIKLNKSLKELYIDIEYIKLDLNTYLDKTYMLVGFDLNTNMPIYVMRKNELDEVHVRKELADYWSSTNM